MSFTSSGADDKVLAARHDFSVGLLLDLVVRHELTRIRLPQTCLDLRDEAEPLDGIVDRGVFGQR